MKLPVPQEIRWVALILLAGIWLLGLPCRALEFHGSAQVFGGPVTTDLTDQRQVDQRYNFTLSQQVTPWLNLQLLYRLTDFRTSFDNAATFERRSRQPEFQLVYDRPTFTARLSLLERAFRSTIESQNLDVTSYLGQLVWRPSWGPKFSLRFEDTSNVADAAVFGRDTDTSFLDFNIVYNKRLWNARYSHTRSLLQNNLTGFRLEQNRHELRGAIGKRFWRNRLYMSLDGWVRTVDQVQDVPEGAPLNQPLPADRGLFAVDPAPEVGELIPTPGLIDGDLQTPVTPPIDIGGANTFRNIGVDLGITRQVTQLEIAVDRPSSPVLVWEVYQSPDNLVWDRIQVDASGFDQALLRYTLLIPETTNRFFKAVNMSANAVPEVLVTEIRALLEIDELAREEGRVTPYRASLFASIDPHARFGASVFVSVRQDEDLAGGRLSRERDAKTYGAQLRFGLARNLVLHLGYRLDDIEENLEPALKREEEVASANLEWTPLPTVDAVLTASQRKETEHGELIRSSDNIRLRALTDLLPQLRLTSELGFTLTDDPFFGFEQTSIRWLESLDSRPLDNWTLGASISYIHYDSTGTVNLTKRVNFQLRTTWQATRYLALNGDWNYGLDDFQATLDQRYGVSWSPGRKLSVLLSYQSTGSEAQSTTTSTANANYRLNRWVTMWFNLSRSTTGQTGLPGTEINSWRLGLNLFF
jgi:hypothetical protein